MTHQSTSIHKIKSRPSSINQSSHSSKSIEPIIDLESQSNQIINNSDHLKKTNSSSIHSKNSNHQKNFNQNSSKSSIKSVNSISIPQLNSIIESKSIKNLHDLGGLESLFKLLDCHPTNGIIHYENSSSLSNHINLNDRIQKFGQNVVPQKKTKSLIKLVWLALQDKVLIILIIAAIISLGLGLYTTFGTPPKTYQDSNGRTIQQPQVDWVEGVAILVAVAIVTLVGSVNDYQKELQFKKLNAQKEDRSIKVIRNGHEQLLSIHHILVGDILLVDAGDVLPADGIFIDGFQVKCDEASVTGESDLIKKINYHDALQFARAKSGQSTGPFQSEVELGKTDCFMVSGSRVVEGYGRYLVTAVGPNSFHGKIMMSLRTDSDETPLQLKLNSLAELIAKLGATAGLLLFVALMIRFFVQLKTQPDRSPSDKAQSFIQVLIISVTVVVVAVPEGLPLAVTLALAFATRRMTKMNLLVRVLSSCETMANATVVCTDKTGTLTQNQMTIVAGSIGVHCKFATDLEKNETRVNINDDLGSSNELDQDVEHPSSLKINIISDDDSLSPLSKTIPLPSRRLDFSIDQGEINNYLNFNLKTLLNEAIAINSTAFEAINSTGQLEFIGSKTETALLSFAKNQSWPDYRQVRESADIIQMIPFSSQRKAMGVVIRIPETGHYRFFLKGASEVLTQLASHYVYVQGPSDEQAVEEENLRGDQIKRQAFDSDSRANVSRTIMFYANQSLRTIALCYRDFQSWPPMQSSPKHDGTSNKEGDTSHEVAYEDLLQGPEGLILLAVVAIEDPLRPGVANAVSDCVRAGVAVKMVTGDNIITAKSIASQCGIYTPGGIIMEGPVFRQLNKREMLELVPRLQVLARSSPEDKKRLVSYLKFMGEVCAVTGDGTNDGPALKAAHVGFSMGISGTEVAKEASDIILMDDNFSSIVSAIMWGRCVNDSVKKFLQFQLSVNITAVLITFITSIASDKEESILTAVQLLWVNLIMDTFAALALATDPATPDSLDRKPDHKSANLINIEMWKMIIGQSIYQLAIILVLNFAGKQILGLNSPSDEETRIRYNNEHKTLIFNAFVFCQIWNQFNARVLDRGLNVFKSIHRNYYFMIIFLIMLGGQILIVQVGGAAFQVTSINIQYWAISVIIGLVSLPLGLLIKLIPTELIGDMVYGWGWMRDPSKLELDLVDLDEDEEKDGDSNKWNPAIDKVRDNLAIFGQIRGGRMRSSSFVKRSRHYMMKEKGIHTGALMTMVPTLVMTSIGAGWQPRKPNGSLADPASANPTRSTTKLWFDKVEVHPDTDIHDPVLVKFRARKRNQKLTNDQSDVKPSLTSAEGLLISDEAGGLSLSSVTSALSQEPSQGS
ncbi:hypothetical protein O181_037122 [Austropuccinia psidii MF-1]|uniref:Calcium-transporting ATPase 2 n=1 Tax=Austropuccinia psidii MF-1 TaxID=1389203 RepID=A0A9Q3D8D8_9BASI|nr:hypothetical protein [Austropuccinia psidii MF-1]